MFSFGSLEEKPKKDRGDPMNLNAIEEGQKKELDESPATQLGALDNFLDAFRKGRKGGKGDGGVPNLHRQGAFRQILSVGRARVAAERGMPRMPRERFL